MNTERPTTIIVDLSVMVHSMHEKHSILPHNIPAWKALIDAQLTYIMSGDWLGALKPDSFKVVFVTDSKPYWRTEYLKRPEVIASVPRLIKKNGKGQVPKPEEKHRLRLAELIAEDADRETDEFKALVEKLEIHYKAGRKFPEYSFTKLKKIAIETVKRNGWMILGQEGYEADDIAATIVMVNKSIETPNRIILLTIDSDWMGLIDEHTAWFCSHGWFPRVRSDLHSINVWAEKRLRSTLVNPRDIWTVKGMKGDASDNIPPSNGVLLPVIDLLAPPEEYRLWDTDFKFDVLQVLEGHRVYDISGTEAMEYLASLGISRVVRQLDTTKDLAA